jgi:primosomal protein N'
VSEHPFATSESTATIAEIAVAGAWSSGDGLLSYAVPTHERGSVTVGQVVWVPLRGKPALGVITRLHDEAPAFAVKPLLAPVDPPTRVSTDQLDTARWLARQSASSLYDALSLFLPPGASHRARPYLRMTDLALDPKQFTPAQGGLLKLLAESGVTRLYF